MVNPHLASPSNFSKGKIYYWVRVSYSPVSLADGNLDELSQCSLEDPVVTPEAEKFNDLENMSGSRFTLNDHVNVSHLTASTRHCTCRNDLGYALSVTLFPNFHSLLDDSCVSAASSPEDATPAAYIPSVRDVVDAIVFFSTSGMDKYFQPPSEARYICNRNIDRKKPGPMTPVTHFENKIQPPDIELDSITCTSNFEPPFQFVGCPYIAYRLPSSLTQLIVVHRAATL